MRIFLRQFCCFSIISVLSLAMLACEESPDSENTIQKTLDKLILDLDTAVGGNNELALQEIITNAKRIRPSSNTQTQSKNMLLSTARGKLSQLKFQVIFVEVNSVKAKLQLAATQSDQVAMLRSTAASMYASAQQQGKDKSKEIESDQQPKLDKYNNQLQSASLELSNLEAQSTVAREEAEILRKQGVALFDEAEEQGLIDGHGTFKHGVRIIRKSQQMDMSAAAIELESQMDATPLLEDAKAELEAIASILLGMENTRDLLSKLRESSKTSAANLLLIADELDNRVAETMNEAIASSSALKTQWNEVTSMIQDALQSSGLSRDNSHETKQASAMWKLDMEWTLGNVEESKHKFLVEEARALTSLIQNEIVTTSSKWIELSNQTRSELEQSTISAIAAFTNAKQLAGSAGSKAEALSYQLDNRIAMLQGKKVPQQVDPTQSFTETTSPRNTPTTIGFLTPQELISAFNAEPPYERPDGTKPAPDLSIYYEGADSNGQKVIGIMQKIATSSANLAIAIRNNVGSEAIKEMIDSLPPSLGGGLKINLEPNTLTMQGDDNATVTDVSGESLRLQNTSQGWKILMGGNPDADPQVADFAMMMLESLGAMADVVDSVTEQINSGQITSLDQLENAMQEAASGIDPF